MRRINLQTRSGCSDAYEQIANAAGEATDELALRKLDQARRCVDGSVYLNGTLPVKLAVMVFQNKGTPYVDIPFAEVEGRPMLRGKKD